MGWENTSVSISDLHWTPTYLEGNETFRASTSWNCKPQILYLLKKRYNSVVAIITSHSALLNEEQVTCCLLESGPVFSQITLLSSRPRWIKVCPSVCFWLGWFCFAETRVHTHSWSSTALDPLWSHNVSTGSFSHCHLFLGQVFRFLAWDAPVVGFGAHLVVFEGRLVKDRQFFYRLRR